MSPAHLRRYRAERLLRGEFVALRGRVLASVRARLSARGVRMDASDLEACYAQAWQGLYMTLLEGEEVANPAGWLTLTTFRRAIDERRAGERAGTTEPCRVEDESAFAPSAGARDLAEQLHDQVRLRQLFEGLRGRLQGRERDAAALCYLQGLTRAQAAARLGMSESRMDKLMEGRGRGVPGVAGKVGALVEAIREGEWCEQQGSLMRALAYGVLDPDGERYRLAMLHRSQCPACRRYVISLRGLAAALPPVLLPLGAGVAALGGAAGEGARAGAGAGATSASAGSTGGAGGGGLALSGGVGGTVSGGGVAGGGWLLGTGPLGAKLAVGCMLALGVGASCAALESRAPTRAPVHRARHAHAARLDGALADGAGMERAPSVPAAAGRGTATASTSSHPPSSPSARASREFGPEQESASTQAGAGPATAHSASSVSNQVQAQAREPAPASGQASERAGAGAGEGSAAAREFSPG
jgi:DNA-directed RNA polymerase specialized sigma24 family protein